MRSILRSFLRTSKSVARDVDPRQGNDTHNSANRADTVGLNFLVLERKLTGSKVTYVFVITIMTIGAGTCKRRGLRVLALYNASCERNYISGRFATYARNNQLLDMTELKEDSGEIVALIWTCPGLGRLGRYKQRTIFWVAPEAVFDVLFGPEKNFNALPHHTGQFDEGIKAGQLTREIPPMSFETGVDEGFLLPVNTSTTADDKLPAVLMPTLTEIQAQLDYNSQKDIEYERMSELNNGRIALMHLESSESFENANEGDSLLASPPASDNGASWHEAGSSTKHPSKRSYSLRSEQISSGEVKADERRRKSLKSETGSMSMPYRRSASEDPSSNTYPTKLPCLQSDEFLSRIDDRQKDIGFSSTAIALAAQGSSVEPYPSPPPSTRLHDASSEAVKVEISASVGRGNSEPHQRLDGRGLQEPSRKKELREKRIKTKNSIGKKNRLSKGSLHFPNLSFDQYWTLDLESGEYFHEDERTGERLLYKPPPP
jgi:hypothetical protein